MRASAKSLIWRHCQTCSSSLYSKTCLCLWPSDLSAVLHCHSIWVIPTFSKIVGFNICPLLNIASRRMSDVLTSSFFFSKSSYPCSTVLSFKCQHCFEKFWKSLRVRERVSLESTLTLTSPRSPVRLQLVRRPLTHAHGQRSYAAVVQKPKAPW